MTSNTKGYYSYLRVRVRGECRHIPPGVTVRGGDLPSVGIEVLLLEGGAVGEVGVGDGPAAVDDEGVCGWVGEAVWCGGV